MSLSGVHGEADDAAFEALIRDAVALGVDHGTRYLPRLEENLGALAVTRLAAAGTRYPAWG